ncbi:MAG TPA: outer membrane beta-barrel protein [Niabella sp.]
MKHLIFSALFLFAGMQLVNAQTGWNIGDRVAIGHSWMVGNRPDDSKRKFHFSYELGRAATYNFSNNTGIGFGTYFSSQGGAYELQNDTKMIERANYIKIPVFASFAFGAVENRVRPRLTVGPSVQFLVGGKTFAKNDNDAFAGVYTTKALNTKIDAGANASLGLNIRVCDGFYINNDINYYHGFVEQKPNNAAESPSYTNRGLYLSMGMQINGQAMKQWKHKMSNHKNRN